MLVTMREILDTASKENYAVAAPNVCNELDIRACLYAAEKMNSPVILNVAPTMTADIVFLGRYAAILADETTVPVALNLDHGGSENGGKAEDPVITDIMSGLKGDFTSVMVDRSKFSFEENIRQVATLAKMAHALGLSVEAELGHVGQGDNEDTEQDRKRQFTDPAQAREYVEKTKVDCLAVSIGNSHGAYKNGAPHIDFERLAEIKKAVNGLPLVLHGGSGTGEDNLRKACSMGINKVNLCNDILISVGQALKAADLEANGAYNIWSVIEYSFADKLMEFMELLGSKNKAWRKEKKYPAAKDRMLVALSSH